MRASRILAAAAIAGATTPAAVYADERTEARLERVRALLRDAGVGRSCRTEGFDGILVCAAPDDRLGRVAPPPLLGVEATLAALKFAPPRGAVGVGATIPMNFLQRRPPPIMPDIDFAALPLAAPGSDADKIARGVTP